MNNETEATQDDSHLFTETPPTENGWYWTVHNNYLAVCERVLKYVPGVPGWFVQGSFITDHDAIADGVMFGPQVPSPAECQKLNDSAFAEKERLRIQIENECDKDRLYRLATDSDECRQVLAIFPEAKVHPTPGSELDIGRNYYIWNWARRYEEAKISDHCETPHEAWKSALERIQKLRLEMKSKQESERESK